MTIQELHIKLKESGVPESRYYLHGLYGSTSDDERLSLTITRGTYIAEYEVYFKERGEKNSMRIFIIEDEACQYIYELLLKELEYMPVK